MLKSTLKGVGLLIAGFLVLDRYTGAKQLIGAGADGGSKVIGTLQGR